MRIIAISIICVTILSHLGCDREPTETQSGQEPAAGNDIEGKIQRIVASILNVSPSKIDPAVQLTDPSIGADDLDIVEIVMEIEDTFDIAIPDEKVVDPETKAVKATVKRLATIVKEQQSTKQRR